MMRNKYIYVILLITLTFTACAIRDDIPYPIVEGAITAFEVDGQCNEDDNGFAAATIDKDKRTVDVFVSDIVDVKKLRIKSIEVSNDATIHPDPELCINSKAFPTTGFTTPGAGADTRINFSGDSCQFIIRTYQDYKWKVRVHQVVLREVRLTGQVGTAIINPNNCTAIINVARGNDFKNLKASKFNLGGQHGTVTPDPTASATYDFSNSPYTFQVYTAATGLTQSWRVYVNKTDATELTTASAFPHSAAAYISGEVPTGAEPVIEYHSDGTSEWTKVNPSQITQKDRSYTAKLTGLKPSTQYTYRVTGGDSQTDEQTFTTAGTQQLENGGMEEWSISGEGLKAMYQPWGEGKNAYWGTGNPGATTVGASNSTYVDIPGRGRVANLQSKFIVIKFAAGNIFTGDYLKTDGPNGILGFGRPFNTYPTKLRFDYKYHSAIINKLGDWSNYYTQYITQDFFEGLKGKPDTCSVYIALIGDKDEEEYKGVTYPYIIRTRPSTLHLFDPNSDNVIAYGQFTKGEDVNDWTTETITIDYRFTNRQPKYIIVVASSSKFGDYFIGGAEDEKTGDSGSLLQIDNFELLYE